MRSIRFPDGSRDAFDSMVTKQQLPKVITYSMILVSLMRARLCSVKPIYIARSILRHLVVHCKSNGLRHRILNRITVPRMSSSRQSQLHSNQSFWLAPNHIAFICLRWLELCRVCLKYTTYIYMASYVLVMLPRTPFSMRRIYILHIWGKATPFISFCSSRIRIIHDDDPEQCERKINQQRKLIIIWI